MKKLGRKLTVLLTLATLLLTLCVTASAAGSLSVRLRNFYSETTSHGASVTVYKNGTLLETVTLDGVTDYTWECPDFDDTAAYTMYWNKGTKDYSIHCQIRFNGTRVFNQQGLNNISTGTVLYNTCTDHSYVGGACSKCGVACPHDVTVRSAQDVCGSCGITVPSEIAFGTGADDLTLGRGGFLAAADYMYANKGSYYAKLLKDATLDEYADFGAATVTLDLAGFTVTSADDAIYLRNDGSLTVDDSVGGGGITALDGTALVGATTGSGVCYITLKSGTIVGSSRGIGGDVVTIEGGSVTGSTFGVNANGALTMTGGTVEGSYYVLSGKTITVTGGTFSSADYALSVGSPAGLDLSAYTGELIGRTVTLRAAGDALDAKLPAGLGFYKGSELVMALSTGYAYTIGECTLPALRFDANGGEGAMTSAYVTEGYTLPACTFTGPNGALFLAWEIGGTQYAAGDALTLTESATAKAVWELARSVSFDANGAEGTMESVGVADGAAYTLPECTFTYAHKRFDCWEVNGERKAAGESITVTADTVAKALWLDTYTVTYHINLEGKTDTYVVEDVLGDYTLGDSPFDKPVGKSFSGWMTKADGTEVEYYPYAALNVTSPVDLYALFVDDEAWWGADAANLTNSGSLGEAFAAAEASSAVGYIKLAKDVPVYYVADDGTFTLDFAGHTVTKLTIAGAWGQTVTLTDSSADGSGGILETLTFIRGANADGTIIAGSKIIIEGGEYRYVDAQNDYEVSVTGGVFTDSFSVSESTSVTVTGGEFHGDGTAVLRNNGGSLTVKGGDFYPDGSKYLLYALGAYANTFCSLEGGNYHGTASVAEVYHGTDARVLIPIVWEGFRLYRASSTPYSTQWLNIPSSWHVFDPAGEEYYNTYDMGAGLHTIYSSDKCIISFDPNGGSGTMENIERRVAIESIMPNCTFTPPEGYAFLGWATSPDGDPVEKFIPKGRTATFYAIWEAAEANWATATAEYNGLLSKAIADLNAGKVVSNTIWLNQDITITQPLHVTTEGILQLGSHTLTGKSDSSAIIVDSGGALEVRGYETSKLNGHNAISSYGTLHLNGVTLSLGKNATQVVHAEAGSTLTLTGVRVETESGALGKHINFNADTTLNAVNCGNAHGLRVVYSTVVAGTVRNFGGSWGLYTLDGAAVATPTGGTVYVLCDGHTGSGLSYARGIDADGNHTVYCPCGHSFEQEHTDADEDTFCDHCGEIAYVPEVAWGVDNVSLITGSWEMFEAHQNTSEAAFVRLLTDIELEKPWIISFDTIVDLNGKTLSCADSFALSADCISAVQIGLSDKPAYVSLTGTGSSIIASNGAQRAVDVLSGSGVEIAYTTLDGPDALYVRAGAYAELYKDTKLFGEGSSVVFESGSTGLLNNPGGWTEAGYILVENGAKLDLSAMGAELWLKAANDLSVGDFILPAGFVIGDRSTQKLLTETIPEGTEFGIARLTDYLEALYNIVFSSDGVTVSEESPVRTLVLANYSDSGQMLSCRVVSAGESLTVKNFFESEYTCFFLDENGVPVLPSVWAGQLET